MRNEAKPQRRRLLHGITATLAVAAGVLAFGGSAAAAGVQAAPGQPAADAVCIPEARVCQGVSGSPGSYEYTFRILNAPTTLGITWTINGAQASGSYTQVRNGTTLQGTFRPFTALVTGDQVCMWLTGGDISPGPYCATTP
ncbi:hypothetical protein ACFOY2_54420 [Nonomuraea purpurea]|uniref:Ig-like domain-containing protein n=1 Tax=Nonomuraea purpurea TaxID=1849276 RepID=A0ABV8GR25_9ACTN